MTTKKTANFTIVIPTLNEEKYLPNLLKDLADQTFWNFEVIVVDGKSDDKTADVANSFKNKFYKLIVLSSEKRNVSYQRNLGAKYAKSDWIIFMDADNRLPEYVLEGISYKIKLHGFDMFTSQTGIRGKSKKDEVITGVINLVTDMALAVSVPGAQGALIGVRKRVFKQVGGFDESLYYAEDWDFVKRAYRAGAVFKVLHDPKYYFSLRRFKRDSKIESWGLYIILIIKLLTGAKVTAVDYPMGGKVDQKQYPVFLRSFGFGIKNISQKQKIIKKLRLALKKLKEYSR